MKHSKKYLVCAFMVGASFVACCIQPMTAKGIEISYDEQAGIQDYLQAGKQGLLNIDFQLDEDEDGNRSTRLSIYGLQQATFSEQFKIYDDMDFSIAPASFTMGGSFSSAMYRLSTDGKLYPVTVMPVVGGKYPWIAATSQHFNISISLSNYLAQGDFPSVTSYVQYGVNGSTRTGFYFSGSGQNRHIFMTDKSGFFQNYEQQTGGCYFYISSTTIPIFSQGQRLNFTGTIGGYGVNIDLPQSDVPTLSPWDYYNDVLLPYIRQNYNITNIEDYFVFPDGYNPDSQPKTTTIPIIYPTAPVFDQGLDESGTQPTGIESINYELPQLETKTVGIPAFDLTSLNPNQVMQPLSNGLAGLWALVTDLLNTFELFPLVSLALLVGVIGGLLLLGR